MSIAVLLTPPLAGGLLCPCWLCLGGRSSNSVSLDRTTKRSIDERELCFSSRHRGGVQAVLVDGHVKFFAETIDPQVWSALGTRNNGEVIPDSL
ncbi:H-X9-DG-CTERM domain-containing protein [Rosistilla oblonga]|uniref:H-X9-DG-CTERM domain-containing protein n=1 Tax=Rosistilla oblonga TaxID=2527990 RepID=UPI003A972A4E